MPLITLCLLLVFSELFRDDIAIGVLIISLILYYSSAIFLKLKKLPFSDLGMQISMALIFIYLIITTL